MMKLRCAGADGAAAAQAVYKRRAGRSSLCGGVKNTISPLPPTVSPMQSPPRTPSSATSLDDYKLRFALTSEIRLVRLTDSTRAYSLIETLAGTASTLFASPGCTLGYTCVARPGASPVPVQPLSLASPPALPSTFPFQRP